MSRVTSVSVQQNKPSVQQPNNGVTTAGRSAVSWSFVGVYSDGNRNTVVVIQAGSNLSSRCQVTNAGDGGVFSSGSDGQICLLTTATTDLNNWTVRTRTDGDGNGGGIVFQGGNGGGHKPK